MSSPLTTQHKERNCDNEPRSRTNPIISPALPILTKSGRAEAAEPPLPDPAIVDLRTPLQPDESHNIARTTDFDEKWTCRSGSASSPRSYHRRPPNPLAAARINKIRPRTGLHRGYPTKFPIPSIGPKIGLLYPARLPLYIPTIGDLPNPLEEPQIPKFEHVVLPVGGQYCDGVVELSRSATVGKPETRRKENRNHDETNNTATKRKRTHF